MYAMEEVPAPIESGQLEGQRVTKIAAGHSHAACVVEGGRLFFWGMSLHLEPELVTSLLHTKVRFAVQSGRSCQNVDSMI